MYVSKIIMFSFTKMDMQIGRQADEKTDTSKSFREFERKEFRSLGTGM
jgi:hypothetical protein